MIPSFDRVKEGWPELRLVHGRAVRPFLRKPWCGATKKPHELEPVDLAELWERVKFWIWCRMEQLRREGMTPLRACVDRAINETGLEIDEKQRAKVAADWQKQWDEAKPVPIVVASQREYDDEIEAAKARGEFEQATATSSRR